MAGYFATADDHGVQLHQYGELRIDTVIPAGRIRLAVSADYPVSGRIRVTVEEAPDAEVRIALRIPAWARGRATLAVADEPAVDVEGPQAVVARTFRAGDRIELVLPMEPRYVHPHPRIDAVRGQVAVERGPLVLALEDVDLPDGRRRRAGRARPVAAPGRHRARGRGDPPAASRLGRAPPYGDAPGFSDGAPTITAELRPYKDWANRGPSTMRVWMPALGAPPHADGSP